MIISRVIKRQGGATMTNRELAKRLGISPASLSLIINNKPGVSDATRARVTARLREMGHGDLIKPVAPEDVPAAQGAPLPSPLSVSTGTLEENKGQLCFLIYKHGGQIVGTHPFFVLLMESLEARARQLGYTITLVTFDHDLDIAAQLDVVRRTGCKGILLFASEMDEEDLEPFQGISVPVATIDHAFAHRVVDSVSIDNRLGCDQLIEHLHDLGHRRIGYLRSATSISSFRERERAFRESARDFGVTIDDEFVWEMPFMSDACTAAMAEKLASPEVDDLPTAFVCDSDTIAIGALRAFAARGIQVPADVSITGFDNRPECEMSDPPLTTIDTSRQAMSAAAVNILVERIEHADPLLDKGPRIQTRIGTTLVIRKSTGIPRQ